MLKEIELKNNGDRMKKKLIIATILSLLVFNSKVMAFTVRSSSTEKYTNGQEVSKKYDDDNTIYYCTGGLTVYGPPTNGADYFEIAGLTDEQRVILASIIGLGSGSNFSMENYFNTEVAINSYLGKNLGNAPAIAGTTIINSIESSENTLIYRSTFSPSLQMVSGESLGSLDFFIDGDYYRTNNMKIVGAYIESTTLSNASVTGVTGLEVVGSIDNFYIRVPKINLTKKNTVNLSIDLKQKAYRYATEYKTNATGGTDSNGLTITYQNVITDNKTNQRTANVSLSGVVGTTQLKVIKLDQNGKALAGAKIRIEKEDKSYSEEFITTKNPIELVGLPFGKYTITELSAPDKYVLDNKPQEVTFTENDLIKTVTFKNNFNKTVISKVNAVDGKELPGATLEVLNEKKEKMSCTILDKDGKEKVLDECSWISGDKPITILGLLNGKYYLKETIAPEGYTLNQEMVKFNINGKDEIVNVKMNNELIVEVPNTLSSKSVLLLSIAMIDIALGIGVLLYVKRNKIEE